MGTYKTNRGRNQGPLGVEGWGEPAGYADRAGLGRFPDCSSGLRPGWRAEKRGEGGSPFGGPQRGWLSDEGETPITSQQTPTAWRIARVGTDVPVAWWPRGSSQPLRKDSVC